LLSINASKIKSFRLVEKRRIKMLFFDFSSTVFRFQAKIKPSLVKTKDRPGSGHARSSLHTTYLKIIDPEDKSERFNLETNRKF
jgi:hypothetical protein